MKEREYTDITMKDIADALTNGIDNDYKPYNKQKYKITLYVTKGCKACDIMDRNIKSAISSILNFKPTYNVFDKINCWNELLKAEGVKDFPTMIFYINDKISFKLEGTYSAKSIKNHILEVINRAE